MKGKPGTRANIPPSSRAHINARATAYPRIQRTELAKKLQVELEAMGYDVPEVEVLERKISEFRNNPVDPKDKPWSIGTLVQYPIPPEALLTVLEAWARYRKQGDTLTVREALWFSRLSSVLSEFERVGDKNRNLGNLVQWYAIRERAYEAIGEAIDTTDLDTEVLKLLKLIEREPGEDKTLPFVYEDGYIKDATGKIRGMPRIITTEKEYRDYLKGLEEGGTQ